MNVFVLTITQKNGDQMHKLRKKTRLNYYAKIGHPQNTCKFDRALTTTNTVKRISHRPGRPSLLFPPPWFRRRLGPQDELEHAIFLEIQLISLAKVFSCYPKNVSKHSLLLCLWCSPWSICGQLWPSSWMCIPFLQFHWWPASSIGSCSQSWPKGHTHTRTLRRPFLCHVQWSGPAHDEASSCVTPPSLRLFRRYPPIRRSIRSKTTRTAKTRCPRPTVDKCHHHPNPGHATGPRTRTRTATTTTWRNEHWILKQNG